MLPATSIHCYRCGNTYQFIGRDAHPGVCPRCGSRVVSPSGDLALGVPKPIRVEGSTSTVDHVRQVVALDDSGREFRYVFVLDDTARAYLTCVTVAGISVQVEDAIGGRLAPLHRLNDLFENHLVTVDASSPLYKDDPKPDWREEGDA